MAGPDHLSALATLCASESARTSFLLGLQWGVGHSIGLLVIGGIFIAITTQNDEHDAIEIPESVTSVFENLVGIFMICLGIFGIYRAWMKRKLLSSATINTNENDNDDEENASPATEELLVHVQGAASLSMVDAGAATLSQPEDVQHRDQVDEEQEGDGVMVDASPSQRVAPTINSESEVASSSQCGRRCRRHFCSTGTALSLIAGLVHGLAGPGGVLGVLPAVQIRNPLLGSMYLITFCLFSTLTMGCFAACYGRLFAKRIGWEFRIECASACLSLVVGILWLILVGTGKMEEVLG